jgi:hypothetical protein
MVRGLMACVLVASAVSLSLTSRAAAAATPSGELNSPMPSARLIGIPLVDAIGFLHDVAGLNINVDWKTLESLKISKDVPINLNLHNVRTEKVLQMVLAQAGGDLLTYYIDGNVVQVTSRAKADEKIVVVVYFVDDLLSLDDSFDYTVADSVTASSGGASSGGSSGVFGSGNSQTNGLSPGASKQQKADALIKLVEKLVRPEVWKDNGGNAQIQYFNGSLIIAAPRSVHELIGGPLQ